MGITFTAPPLVRFLSWLSHRETLCEFCRKAESTFQPEGSRRYCSSECMEADADEQVEAL